MPKAWGRCYMLTTHATLGVQSCDREGVSTKSKEMPQDSDWIPKMSQRAQDVPRTFAKPWQKLQPSYALLWSTPLPQLIAPRIGKGFKPGQPQNSLNLSTWNREMMMNIDATWDWCNMGGFKIWGTPKLYQSARCLFRASINGELVVGCGGRWKHSSAQIQCVNSPKKSLQLDSHPPFTLAPKHQSWSPKEEYYEYSIVFKVQKDKLSKSPKTYERNRLPFPNFKTRRHGGYGTWGDMWYSPGRGLILLNHDDPISIAKREPRATGDTLLGDHKCIEIYRMPRNDQCREILDIVIDHPSNSWSFGTWTILNLLPVNRLSMCFNYWLQVQSSLV